MKEKEIKAFLTKYLTENQEHQLFLCELKVEDIIEESLIYMNEFFKDWIPQIALYKSLKKSERVEETWH